MRIETITTKDKETIQIRRWPVATPKATLQILHGMAEHCDRYKDFAEYLQSHDIEVIAHNHRGHGERTPIGHFADEHGWELVLDDVQSIQATANPDVPVFVFGHSMGSFIARDFLARHNNKTAGVILSGSNQQHPALFHAAQGLASLLAKLQGKRHPSSIMNFLSFGAFNNHFKPIRTEFDWLCRDSATVDQYIADPLCGNLSSLGFWQDFMGGMTKVHSQAGLKAIPKMPILILGGDKDPVGRMGKGFYELEKQLQRNGHQQVGCKVYAGARHELINETNKEEIWLDIKDWLLAQLTTV